MAGLSEGRTVREVAKEKGWGVTDSEGRSRCGTGRGGRELPSPAWHVLTCMQKPHHVTELPRHGTHASKSAKCFYTCHLLFNPQSLSSL